MNVILERRSIRKYTGLPITKDQVHQLLEAAMAAPSAGNEQPWHFIVLQDRLNMTDIIKYHPYALMLNEAAAAIIVCADEKLVKYEGYWIQDCAAATQNLLLMAQTLGLGSVWLGVYPKEDRIKGLRKLFKLPDNIIPFSIVSIGHPGEVKEPVNRFNEERVHLELW